MPDIQYIRPVGRRIYTSTAKHQRHAHNNHSKWVSVPIEQQTFDAADYGNHHQATGNLPWENGDGNFWGFLFNFPEVGTEKQQFGYFVNSNNPVNYWHGYPAIPFSKKRLFISQELIARWVDEGFLEEDDVEDLLKQKRIK